jgi:hypothetical protein
VEAIYRNGLLMLTIPKSEAAKPRQVRIQLGEASQGQAPRQDQPA